MYIWGFLTDPNNESRIFNNSVQLFPLLQWFENFYKQAEISKFETSIFLSLLLTREQNVKCYFFMDPYISVAENPPVKWVKIISFTLNNTVFTVKFSS